MSRYKYDPHDPKNRPAILDPATGKPLPADHPDIIAANKAYDAASEEEREAFFNVTCLNSRSPADMKLAKRLAKAISERIEAQQLQ